MRIRTMIAAAVLAAGAGAPVAQAGDGVDVLRYELDVALRGKDLAVSTTLRAAGKPPAKWDLELVPEMKVLSAESGGKPVPFTVAGRGVVLDLAGVAPGADGSFAVTVRCEGAPSERFTKERGGFVRTAVGPDLVHVRSQVPWYPRAADDPAIHRVLVDAPAAWQVRSAGDFAAPAPKGDRAAWAFETKVPVDSVGLAAGPWKVVSSEGCDALVFPEHEKAAIGILALARRAMALHGKALGPLPWSRYSLVEMPEAFGPGSGYSEAGYFLLGRGAFDAGAETDWVKGFVAHEAAHQWWGRDGRFSDFTNEALAEYSMLRFLQDASGDDAARTARKVAVDRVAAAAAAGKSIPLSEVKGWGEGMDPETYRVHAYEKPMMVLSMVGDAVGQEAMGKLLAGFLERARRGRVGWADLRAALVEAGPGARTVVEQAERPGLPLLVLECETKKAGGGWQVAGKVRQSGTAKPWRTTVAVVATRGESVARAAVKLDGPESAFSIAAPFEPESVVLDPDWLLLAARGQGGGGPAVKMTLDEAMAVVNDPGENDPAKLERTVAGLRGLIAAGEKPGQCREGIGRCLFRLGKYDAAKEELQTALRVGGFGPFTRSWANLRLGCIADLQKKRDAAVEYYKAVLALPEAGNLRYQKDKARAFTEKPYRGYKVDG